MNATEAAAGATDFVQRLRGGAGRRRLDPLDAGRAGGGGAAKGLRESIGA